MTAGLPMRGEGVEQTCPMSIVKSYMTYIFFLFFLPYHMACGILGC